MAQDTRIGDRQPTSMRIKLKYPDIETFIQKYAVNISRGGIFIATKSPKPVGTHLRFEFVLASGETGLSIIRGEGQVLWTREFDPSQPGKAHGMGIKFTRLDAESQGVVDRALAFRAKETERRMPALEEDDEPASGPVPAAAASSPTPTPTPMPVEPVVAAPVEPPPAPPPLLAPLGAAPSVESSAAPPVEPPAAMPQGRASNEVTRPLPIDLTPQPPRLREDVTRPISVEAAEAEAERAAEAERTKETVLPTARPMAPPRVKLAVERDPSREIRIRGASRDGAAAELEQIARDWGVSEEQIARVLKRRRPRMVEATAELERLLRKPQRAPAPTHQEAMAGLRELLSRRAPVLEIDRTPRPVRAPADEQAQAAGGDAEPVKRAKS